MKNVDYSFPLNGEYFFAVTNGYCSGADWTVTTSGRIRDMNTGISNNKIAIDENLMEKVQHGDRNYPFK